jgi:hypothetical protein
MDILLVKWTMIQEPKNIDEDKTSGLFAVGREKAFREGV